MINFSNKIVDVKTKSTYTFYKFNIGKTLWSVLVVNGKYNYITIKKETSNPFGVLGNDFDNFDKAISHYKNPSMKLNLRLIEMNII